MPAKNIKDRSLRKALNENPKKKPNRFKLMIDAIDKVPLNPFAEIGEDAKAIGNAIVPPLGGGLPPREMANRDAVNAKKRNEQLLKLEAEKLQKQAIEEYEKEMKKRLMGFPEAATAPF